MPSLSGCHIRLGVREVRRQHRSLLRSAPRPGIMPTVTRPAPLLVTSLQAPHADPFCRRLTGYLGERFGRPMRFVDDEPWQARERRLDSGEIDVAWICGLPYARRRDQTTPTVALVAGPVMIQPRYRDRPVYFADVVVRRASPWTTFADLRGTRWA